MGGARGGGRVQVDAPARRLSLGRGRAGRGTRDHRPTSVRSGWVAARSLMGYWPGRNPRACPGLCWGRVRPEAYRWTHASDDRHLADVAPFEVISDFSPSGDQPSAINEIAQRI